MSRKDFGVRGGGANRKVARINALFDGVRDGGASRKVATVNADFWRS